MSAIGDYIHLTKKGYLNYGTQRADGKPKNLDIVQIYSIQKSNILSQAYNKVSNQRMNENEMRELEQGLKFLLNPGSSPSAVQQKKSNEIWNELITQLDKEFHTNVSERVQRSTANVTSQNNFSNINKIKPTGDSINLSTIMKRIAQMQAQINDIKNIKTKNSLSQKINNIINQLSEITNITIEELKSTGYDFQIDKLLPGYKKSIRLDMESSAAIIDEINKIIAVSRGASSLQKGTLFEYGIAMAPALVGKMSYTSVEDCIKNMVVGTSGKSNVKIDTSKFVLDTKYFDEILGSHYVNNSGSLYVSTHASQDKVDVNMTWNNKIIPVSAKNINLQNNMNISLVTGASLLALIQNYDVDFINHYLNAVSEHSDGNLSNTVIHQAHSAMKASLLLSAFGGYKSGSQKADIFIVNDNSSKGNIKVYSIGELIIKIIKNIEAYTNITYNEDKAFSGVILANKYSESGYETRLMNILKQIHSMKIHVAITPSVLTK